MRRLLFKLPVICFALIIGQASMASDKVCFYADDNSVLIENVLAKANPADTLPGEDEGGDTIIFYNVNPASFQFKSDTISTKFIQATPSITVPQMVKGMASGVYVQEATGEPGSAHQYMYIRGLNRPLLSPKELYLSQPAVYVRREKRCILSKNAI